MAWYAPAFENLSAGSLRRPPFSSLAYSKECSAQTEWSKAGSIDGNTGGSSLVVGKPANEPCRQISRYGTYHSLGYGLTYYSILMDSPIGLSIP